MLLKARYHICNFVTEKLILYVLCHYYHHCFFHHQQGVNTAKKGAVPGERDNFEKKKRKYDEPLESENISDVSRENINEYNFINIIRGKDIYKRIEVYPCTPLPPRFQIKPIEYEILKQRINSMIKRIIEFIAIPQNESETRSDSKNRILNMSGRLEAQ